MKAIWTLSVALATWLASSQGWAQDFPPKKQISLVVGFAAGGAADNSARLIAKKLGENIGQTIVVENKAGVGGNIAHHQVATGPTDGSVILLGSIGPLAVAPHLLKLNYDPQWRCVFSEHLGRERRLRYQELGRFHRARQIQAQ
jgi:tripartite-type tricarboxylate transporter receptor subunit TctC